MTDARAPKPVPSNRREPAPPRPAEDPNGVGPADKAAEGEPKGRPISDRHDMETTVAKQPPRR
jgi:hypothetical protein